MQITKLTQQNISSVSACNFFLISFLVVGPALPSFESQRPGLSRGPCHHRGQEKAKPPSSPPAQWPNLHACRFPLPATPFSPLFVGKFLLIFQVSAETSPPPRSPPCPRRGSQSLAPLSRCGVLVYLSNQLPRSAANSTRTLIDSTYLVHDCIPSPGPSM